MCSKFLAAELDSKCEGKRKILKTSIIGLQLYKKTISRVKVGVLLVLHILLPTYHHSILWREQKQYHNFIPRKVL